MRKFYLSENDTYELRVYKDFESDPHDYIGQWIDTREKVLEHINMNPHLLEHYDLTITYTPKPFTIPIEEFMEEKAVLNGIVDRVVK